MATRDLSVRAGWLLWVSAVNPSLHSGQKKHTISAAPMFVPIQAALVSPRAARRGQVLRIGWAVALAATGRPLAPSEGKAVQSAVFVPVVLAPAGPAAQDRGGGFPMTRWGAGAKFFYLCENGRLHGVPKRGRRRGKQTAKPQNHKRVRTHFLALGLMVLRM